jgi:cytochrome c553
LFFDSLKIYNERYPRTEHGFDTSARTSETWEAGYEAFKRGEQLALPYFDQRATDLDKQKQLAGVYRRYHAGELDVHEVPDLSDIYPDDPNERARMGLQTEPDASAEDVLIQACASCHNNILDQEISRARFNIDVSRLDREELDIALDRIQRDRNEPGVMPPPESRQLDDAGRKRLMEFLKREQHMSEPNERLAHAAEIGMAGGEVTREVLR